MGGFTALWLIGLWERSNASQTIKKLCGNPDAVASAYSLDRYDIAQALGGYNAYKNLADRCAQRGIRLASDMVPNHMGIDSDWVHDHPDWFIHLEHPLSLFTALMVRSFPATLKLASNLKIIIILELMLLLSSNITTIVMVKHDISIMVMMAPVCPGTTPRN